jgi:hypothetical protein
LDVLVGKCLIYAKITGDPPYKSAYGQHKAKDDAHYNKEPLPKGPGEKKEE